MSVLENLTPFGHGSTCGYGLDDRVYVIHCLAGRFHMPLPGQVHTGPLVLDEPRPPAMTDEYWGDPALTSLKYASQGVVARPGGEVYVVGSAHVPRGRPLTMMRTRVQVGPCVKELQVFGAREWRRGPAGLRPSQPEPFTCVPIRYEYSFGGTIRGADGEVVAQEPRNPVGVGLALRAADAAGMPLPNLEDPDDPLMSWDGRVAPGGFGPIPGGWLPRLRFAGSYDGAWVESRAPLWPKDCEPRFFCAAAPGLSLAAPLHGGERVILEGFAPEGRFDFTLPSYRVIAKLTYTDGFVRRRLVCDGVLLEPDARSLTLLWRCAAPLEEGLRRLLAITLRLLEPWEDPGR